MRKNKSIIKNRVDEIFLATDDDGNQKYDFEKDDKFKSLCKICVLEATDEDEIVASFIGRKNNLHASCTVGNHNDDKNHVWVRMGEYRNGRPKFKNRLNNITQARTLYGNSVQKTGEKIDESIITTPENTNIVPPPPPPPPPQQKQTQAQNYTYHNNNHNFDYMMYRRRQQQQQQPQKTNPVLVVDENALVNHFFPKLMELIGSEGSTFHHKIVESIVEKIKGGMMNNDELRITKRLLKELEGKLKRKQNQLEATQEAFKAYEDEVEEKDIIMKEKDQRISELESEVGKLIENNKLLGKRNRELMEQTVDFDEEEKKRFWKRQKIDNFITENWEELFKGYPNEKNTLIKKQMFDKSPDLVPSAESDEKCESALEILGSVMTGMKILNSEKYEKIFGQNCF